MNTHLEPDEDKLLRSWVVDDPLPPRFNEQVWRRIATAEARSKSSVKYALLNPLAAVFERPKLAYSYAAILLAAGIAAGSVAAQVKSSRWETELGQRYLQVLNPYQQTLGSE